MEKRRYPRVNADLPVVILNQDGDKVETRAKDMSVTGLAVECNIAERDLLTPGGSYVRDGKPVQLRLWLNLPSVKEALEINCHVVYSRRLASDRCKIGMRFLRLEREVYGALVDFIRPLLSA